MTKHDLERENKLPLAIKPPPKKPSFRPHGPHRGGLYARLFGTGFLDVYQPL